MVETTAALGFGSLFQVRIVFAGDRLNPLRCEGKVGTRLMKGQTFVELRVGNSEEREELGPEP
jgi:hypothetical protein